MPVEEEGIKNSKNLKDRWTKAMKNVSMNKLMGLGGRMELKPSWYHLATQVFFLQGSTLRHAETLCPRQD